MRLRSPLGRLRRGRREPSLRSRVRGRIASAAALAIAVAVVVVLVLRSQGSPSAPGATAGSTGLGVTTVQRRNLIASDTESGTLGYASPQTVYNRLSGTITWLPSVGRVIKAGQPLYRVGDKPVILMYGSTPVYRDLDPHDSDGPDIAQLNRNLVRLGFDPDAIVVDDEWQAATTAGVEELQESLGLTATGNLALGRVVFLPGPQLVSEVDATVGGTGSGGSGSSDSSAADPVGAGSHEPQFVSLGTSTTPTQTTTTTTTTSSTGTGTGTGTRTGAGAGTGSTGTDTSTTATTSSTGPDTTPTEPGSNPGTQAPGNSPSSGALSSAIGRLSAEIEALRRQLQAQNAPSSDNKSNSSDKKSNSNKPASSSNSSASEILKTSSPTLVVTVDLSASSQSEAVLGSTVSVEMPDGSLVKGKITAVSRVAQSSSDASSSSGSTIPVTIKLKGRHAGAGLDQAAVSVEFVQSRARHVLSVPVTALVATSGQSYALQEASLPHKLIPVRTGLFAAGDVQVSGKGVVPGLRVTDSEG
jgi:Putative peptidoglycan binding domain